jgi:hypothetical protein
MPAGIAGSPNSGPALILFSPAPQPSGCAVTFWGKRDLRDVLRKALAMLDAHYTEKPTPGGANDV